MVSGQVAALTVSWRGQPVSASARRSANAKSDGANVLDLKMLRPLLEKLLVIHQAAVAALSTLVR